MEDLKMSVATYINKFVSLAISLIKSIKQNLFS
jgi:hypothetical protein